MKKTTAYIAGFFTICLIGVINGGFLLIAILAIKQIIPMTACFLADPVPSVPVFVLAVAVTWMVFLFVAINRAVVSTRNDR